VLWRFAAGWPHRLQERQSTGALQDAGGRRTCRSRGFLRSDSEELQLSAPGFFSGALHRGAAEVLPLSRRNQVQIRIVVLRTAMRRSPLISLPAGDCPRHRHLMLGSLPTNQVPPGARTSSKKATCGGVQRGASARSDPRGGRSGSTSTNGSPSYVWVRNGPSRIASGIEYLARRVTLTRKDRLDGSSSTASRAAAPRKVPGWQRSSRLSAPRLPPMVR